MASLREPNLPGYAGRAPRATNLKQQEFKITAGLMERRPGPLEHIDAQIADTQARLDSLRAHTTGHAATRLAPPASASETHTGPAPVLQFLAFFQQEVTESRDETYRVRYVRINYYLQDGTIMVEEKRGRNTGLEQGVLLRRMQVEKPGGRPFDFYKWADLNIGKDVQLGGIAYHIYGADDFTIEYLQKAGIKVPPAERAPDDLYTAKRELTERPMRVTHIDTDRNQLGMFLKFDKMVLRYYATWDDTGSTFGEKRPFIIFFFLVDGRLEVRQVLQPNSGRDPTSRFLEKTHIKKPDGSLVTPADLVIGAKVPIFGREFLICDADPWTRRYVATHFAPLGAPIAQAPPEFLAGGVPDDEDLPPYNGFGDEEDTVGNCRSLHPQPPRKDIARMLRNQGQVLRFAAHFVDPVPQDEGREFVISFDLAEDKVSVFERPRRNSGFAEGKLVEKSKIRNPVTGQWFVAEDFRLGEIVTINGWKFHLYDCDRFALERMEAESEVFMQANLGVIVEQLRPLAAQLKDAFVRADAGGKGAVSAEVAKAEFIKVGLPEHESTTVIRRFYVEGSGFVYGNFLAVL